MSAPSAPVLVLGMHRSGTSFLVRTLNLAGLWIGPDAGLASVEGRAASGNPKGNYEHRGVIAINDGILRRSGGAWVQPPARLTWEPADLEQMRQAVQDLERTRPAHCARFGFKDPRTLLTLRPWLDALRRPVFLVASFRHPAAVAHSLLARDQIPLPLGYALWAYYNGLLLDYLDHFPHVLIRFDVERDSLVEQVTRACGVLGLDADRRHAEFWFDKALVRSRTAQQDIDEPAAAEIWRRLTARRAVELPA